LLLFERNLKKDNISAEVKRTDPEARVRYPALPETKKVVGLERGSYLIEK
jgi:hypothetical protein